jgi:pimeloyl-ACP methyl ester carboxylesterase
MSPSAPLLRYAKTGDVNIAYRVLGEGPLDLVWVPGLFNDIESSWELAHYVRFFNRLASFSRLIMFDKRGMGLSDRNVSPPTLEDRMDDVRAVMDAVGSERAGLIGFSEGGPMTALFAATHPERTSALVFFGSSARFRSSDDYNEDIDDAVAATYRVIDEGWGTGSSLQVIGRSLLQNEGAVAYAARVERSGGSPGSMRALLDTLVGIDVRPVLKTISAPTLVIHATDDLAVPIGNGRYLANHISNAKFVEIPGEHVVYDVDQVADEIESFVTGRRSFVQSDRVLATVLFTDIVGSTEHLAGVGDRRWLDTLERHDDLIHRLVEDHRGRLVKSTGDGALATFDGPARAVTCGCVIRDQMESLGIDVRMGLHTGEIEVRGDEIGGIAVHIGARVAAKAGAGEILVSRTVTDLVAGSGLGFADRGDFDLKGVPGIWRLFAVAA